ncbi:MAG: YcjF family protein [Xanthobacteraceae bacterium]
MAKEPNATPSPDASETAMTTTPKSDEMKHDERSEQASKLVDRFSVWSGVAGLLPIPVVDLVVVAGLQLQMLRRISQIYEVPFSENRGKALITSLLGAMIPTSSGLGMADALKAIPVVGTLISACVTPVLAAGATYAIGRVFIQHFASGGNLLDFNPPDYKEFLKGQKDMWIKRSNADASHPAPAAHPETSTGATPASS